MSELDELYQEDRDPTPPPHPRILSLANQKGGVGKTTTAINLGTALAAIGERVLIVDLDPQGNASTGLGIDRRNRNCSTYDVLIGEAPLREAARHIGAPAKVHAVRIEDFVNNFKGSLDVYSARALAPLDRLLALAHPLAEKGAQGLLLKGQDVEAELTKASKYWNIEASLVPSKTNPLSRIVVVRSLQRRAAKS